MSYTDPQIGTLTITGDPARFVATERVPVSGLSMDFEPVQDLHGYQYPWPGGGSINKLPPAPVHTETYRGVTFTSDGKGTYTLTGTATGGTASFYIDLIEPSPVVHEGEYLHFRNSQSQASATITFKDITGTGQGTISYIGLSPKNRIYTTINTFEGKQIKSLNFYVANGVTINMTISPSLELTDSDTDFIAYSNICPITGRDSVTVYVSPEPDVVDGTEEHEIEFGQTVYAGHLTINEDGSGQIVSKYANVDLWTLTWSFSTSTLFFYAPIFAPKRPLNWNRIPNALCSAYRVGSANEVTSAAKQIDRTASIPPNSDRVVIYDSNYINKSAFVSAMAGQQFVYELAEPVTIQLDPIEITTLIGLNYVWTSDNNLITITFPYNKEVQPMALSYDHCWNYPKAYIDKLEARIAALETAAAADAEANTQAAPSETRETVAEEITVTEEPETEPVTKKGGK